MPLTITAKWASNFLTDLADLAFRLELRANGTFFGVERGLVLVCHSCGENGERP